MITHANTPFNDRIFLVTIQWWGCVEWWVNFFSHHPKDYHCPMVTKYFWSPQQRLSKNIQCTPFLWQPKSFGCHKEGWSRTFRSSQCSQLKIIWSPQRGPTKSLQSPILVAIKIFSITIGGWQNGTRCGDWNVLSPSYHHSFSNGDRIVLVATKGGLSYLLESSHWESSKGFHKNMWHAPFYGDWKNFGHHPTNYDNWMVTIFF